MPSRSACMTRRPPPSASCSGHDRLPLLRPEEALRLGDVALVAPDGTTRWRPTMATALVIGGSSGRAPIAGDRLRCRPGLGSDRPRDVPWCRAAGGPVAAAGVVGAMDWGRRRRAGSGRRTAATRLGVTPERSRRTSPDSTAELQVTPRTVDVLLARALGDPVR